MSSDRPEVYKEWILNIIDQLRRRKARPDLERICHFVERRYGVERAVTEAHVERLVDQGVVIKVVYKRGTSYRNATKSKTNGYGTYVLNSKSTSRRISEAVQSILKERSESKTSRNEENVNSSVGPSQSSSEIEIGISIRDIENWLSANKACDDYSEPFMCPIRVVIQRELDAGRLIRLENGNYLPRESEVKSCSDRSPLPKTEGVVAKRGRPPKRKVGILYGGGVGWGKRERSSVLIQERLIHSCRFLAKHSGQYHDLCQTVISSRRLSVFFAKKNIVPKGDITRNEQFLSL